MPITLTDVIQTYQEDTASQDAWKKIIASRDASLTTIRPIVERFIAGTTTMEPFRQELTNALHATDSWGATGTGFLMEINKLAKNYDKEGEAEVRRILTGLTAANLGERIEAFSQFATAQKAKMKAAGVPALGQVSPGNSAFIISLFAFWLDRDAEPPIYYPSLRRGLKMLLDSGLLPTSSGLRVSNDMIMVQTKEDHQHAAQAIESIRATDPRIATSPYWKEGITNWLIENPTVLHQTSVSTGGDDDEPTVGVVIPHEPLRATPEALLAELTAELRRSILIDEDVVRRIYHALLAGHVILSGPPGTGKTELARRIPELLWQSEVNAGSSAAPLGPAMAKERTTRSAYVARLVTATDEWSVRTLIGGLTPSSSGGQVSYRIQHGHLTKAILENWAVNEASPAGWATPQRRSVQAPSATQGGAVREFKGRWLVIDEFNRAPIDLALGEALTTLGGSGSLRVPVDGGHADLPVPQDFRIIGTLNSFDRNYLNQISEALKRRFAFIEVLPPTRAQREAEQGIALAKALASVAHLHPTEAIQVQPTGEVAWPGVLRLTAGHGGGFILSWEASPQGLREAFAAAWAVLEIVRVYRQLGTAQAISLLRQMLIAGVVQGHTSAAQWLAAADRALCDTVADQLQVLLPDELDVLLHALTLDHAALTPWLNGLLRALASSPRRLAGQLGALGAVTGPTGEPIVRLPEDADALDESDIAQLSEEQVAALFPWAGPRPALPLFTRRLRGFKLERGL